MKCTNVEEAIKRSAEMQTEAEAKLHVETTLKKAMLVLNKKLAAEQTTTGFNPDKISTEEFKVNGHTVSFILKRVPKEIGDVAHYELQGKIDGKVYRDKEELKQKILQVDGYGLSGKDKVKYDMTKKKDEMAAKMHKEMPLYRRTAMITALRAGIQSTREAERGGETILAKLMEILGHAINSPSR